MTKTELLALVQQAGMVAVPIIVEEDEDDYLTRNFFEGDLDQFLATAKAIGTVAVFIEEIVLDDDFFLYTPGENESSDDLLGGELFEVDLTTVSPDLAKYKKYLGQNYSFWLTAKGGVDDLWFILEQDWVKEFQKELERAEAKADLDESDEE